MFKLSLSVPLVLMVCAWCELASASDTPRCRFIGLSSGLNATVAWYYGFRNQIGPVGYYVTSSSDTGDVYYAQTDRNPRLPCALEYYARSQFPYYFSVHRPGPAQLAAQSRAVFVMGGLEMPSHCHEDFGPHRRGNVVQGFCVRYGLVSVLAYGAGLPTVHVRPYSFFTFVSTLHT